MPFVIFDANMKQRFLKFIKFPFYFALFSLYPVLALIANNIGQLNFHQGLCACRARPVPAITPC